MIDPRIFELAESGAIRLTPEKGQLLRALKNCTIMVKDVEFDISDLLVNQLLISQDGELKRNPFFFPEDVKGTFMELYMICPKSSNIGLAAQYYEIALNEVSHEYLCEKRKAYMNSKEDAKYINNLENWLKNCNWAQDESVIAHADNIHDSRSQGIFIDSED